MKNNDFKQSILDADVAQFPDFDDIKETMDAKSRQNIQHSWHKEGPQLVCDSCIHRHSQWIGMDKTLKGFDKEGRPIISKI